VFHATTSNHLTAAPWQGSGKLCAPRSAVAAVK
jgi:hypothetical protein